MTLLIYCTSLWTPTEYGITWVRSLEAFHKVINEGNGTLAWKHKTRLRVNTDTHYVILAIDAELIYMVYWSLLGFLLPHSDYR